MILAQPPLSARAALRRYAKMPGIRIVWVDLRDYASVIECDNGADYVLHAAALISPASGRDPVMTVQVNVGSIRNILEAIGEQSDPDAGHLATVGSIATTGSRLPPKDWGGRLVIRSLRQSGTLCRQQDRGRTPRRGLRSGTSGVAAPDLHLHPDAAEPPAPGPVPPAGKHRIRVRYGMGLRSDDGQRLRRRCQSRFLAARIQHRRR